jgi:hypothetical protein
MSRHLTIILFAAILFGAATLAVPDPAQARPPATTPGAQISHAESCRLRVSVRSKTDGRPLAKAAIRFLEPETDQRFETDANGIAQLEDMRPQARVFEVRAAGYAVQFVPVAATQPGTTAELGLALEPGGQIRGTVRDAVGRPIAKAGVSLYPKWSSTATKLDDLETDREGRFFCDNVPLDQTLTIWVTHQNQSQGKTVRLSADRKVLTADIGLEKPPEEGSVIVHITGPDRKPIVGARLANAGITVQAVRTGTTDAKGDCRLDHVYALANSALANGHRLIVRAKGFAPRDLNFKPGTSVNPNRIAVELQPGHTIRGRVMLTSGRPVADARILFDGVPTLWSTAGQTRSDSQGRFSLDSLPANCTFSIAAPAGYVSLQNERLTLDSKAEITITLDTAAVIKGRVVDETSGKPVVPFWVRAVGSPSRRGNEPWAQLDGWLTKGEIHLRPDARFEFGDMPPGAPVYLKISAAGYVEQSRDWVIARPDGRFKPLEIRLRKIDPQDLHTVSGTLVNAQGKPVAGAELRLWTTATRPASPTQSPFDWSMIQEGQLEQVPECQQFLVGVTDTEGKFTFRDVRRAAYGQLAWWGKGIAPAREVIDLTGDRRREIKLSLKATAAARLVVEIDPKELPNAAAVMVTYESDMHPANQIIRGDVTRVIFEDLPAGHVDVGVVKAPDESGGVTIEVAPNGPNLKSGETTTFRLNKP